MSEDIINEHTDEKIGNYLSDKTKTLKNDADWKGSLVDARNQKRKARRKSLLIFLFLILLAVLVVAYFAYFKGQWSFDDKKVKIKIEVPSEVSSGEEITFVIKYENNTSVDLRNLKMSFFTPKEFVFISSDRETQKEGTTWVWRQGNLSAGESDKIRLFGKIIGKEGTECVFNSSIFYTPDNFNSEFQSFDDESKSVLKITSIPFEMSIECPKFVINKNKAKCVVTYKNTSKRSFYAEVKVNIPKGFEYISSDPKADESGTEHSLSWNIENLEANTSGELIVEGNITGDRNEEIEIEAILYASEKDKNTIPYLNNKTVIRIQDAPVILSQTINGSKEYFAYKGEELEYKIKFKNNSEMEIKGLVINSRLEGCVNPDSIDVVNGSHDGEKITWNAFNIPKLAVFGVGEEDEVSFKVKVKDFINIENSNDKNFTVRNTVSIKEFDFDAESEKIGKTITSDTTVVKLDTSLFIRAKGYFNDDGRIKNSGVIPPEVGKETKYTIHWNLSNLFNDIENVRIVSIMPEKVKWAGNYIRSDGKIFSGNENNGTFIPEQKNETELEDDEDDKDDNNSQEEEIKEERFYYNPETREIVWEMPKLSANTGVISPAKEVVFQVSITPEEEDIGNVMEIMSEVKATSQDEFTRNAIETFDSALTTELPDDYSIGMEEGIVIVSSEG
ncbi:MAG: hypothetical protein U9N04_00775 [Patescibacteria group bacterium]|nr:hypothetical protein [Patescibacteria group bacterium]